MAEILSQAEIDALLTALSTGKVQAEEIKEEGKQRRLKKYDFRRPDKFSKDQLRTLQMIHETYARLLSSSLSAYLRTMVGVEVVGVDQLTYDEFIRSLPNPGTTFICSLRPLEGSMVMELDPVLSFALIERLLGGKGEAMTSSRELTEIEQTVLIKSLRRFFEGFREAWRNVQELEPALEQLEMNPQFIQVAPPNEMVVLTTFQLGIGEIQGMLNLCIPYSVLEPVLPKLTAHHWFAVLSRTRGGESVAALRRGIEETSVELVVLVGSTQITVRELLQLGVGDLIPLPTPTKGQFTVQIGERVKFRGRPGLVGNRLALQITRIEEQKEKGGPSHE